MNENIQYSAAKYDSNCNFCIVTDPSAVVGPSVNVLIAIGIIGSFVIAALCVIGRKRLRTNGTWFPSNFVRTSSTKSEAQKVPRYKNNAKLNAVLHCSCFIHIQHV